MPSTVPKIGQRLIDRLGLGDPDVARHRIPGRSQAKARERAREGSTVASQPVQTVPEMETMPAVPVPIVSPDGQSVVLRSALEAIGPAAVKAVSQAVRGTGRFRNAPASVRYQAAKDVLQAQGLLRPDATLAERATADMSPEELRRFIAQGQAALDHAQQSGSTVIDGSFVTLPSADTLPDDALDVAQVVAQQPESESAAAGQPGGEPDIGGEQSAQSDGSTVATVEAVPAAVDAEAEAAPAAPDQAPPGTPPREPARNST